MPRPAGTRDPRSVGWPILRDVHRHILRSLVDHRVLSTTQVAVLHTPGKHRSWASRALNDLAGLGLADRTRQHPGHGGRLWWATSHGAQLLAHVTSTPYEPDRLIEPAAVALGAHHATLATNQVGVTLTHWARRHGDTFGPGSWTTDVPLNGPATTKGDALTADATLTYRATTRDHQAVQVDALLELDLGEALAALAGRLHAFDTWRRTGTWKARWTRQPALLVVCARPSREGSPAGRRDRLTDACEHDACLGSIARVLHLGACTLDDLAAHGSHTAIFATPGVGWTTLLGDLAVQ
jgi:hypothetical protein